MKISVRVTLGLLLGAAVSGCGNGASGAASATGASDAAGVSATGPEQADTVFPPPTMNAMFGTRNPRTCVPVKHVPSEAEAAALVQCARDNARPPDLMFLVQNIKVTKGSSRPYIYNSDSFNSNIDTTSEVYPIRVAADWYMCSQEKTCKVTPYAEMEGACYKTTFGDWRCSFSEISARPGPETTAPPPTTY
jgi:hypothetical protein